MNNIFMLNFLVGVLIISNVVQYLNYKKNQSRICSLDDKLSYYGKVEAYTKTKIKKYITKVYKNYNSNHKFIIEEFFELIKSENNLGFTLKNEEIYKFILELEEECEISLDVYICEDCNTPQNATQLFYNANYCINCNSKNFRWNSKYKYFTVQIIV